MVMGQIHFLQLFQLEQRCRQLALEIHCREVDTGDAIYVRGTAIAFRSGHTSPLAIGVMIIGQIPRLSPAGTIQVLIKIL